MVAIKEKLEPLEVIDKTLAATEIVHPMDHGPVEYVITAEVYEQLQRLRAQLAEGKL